MNTLTDRRPPTGEPPALPRATLGPRAPDPLRRWLRAGLDPAPRTALQDPLPETWLRLIERVPPGA